MTPLHILASGWLAHQEREYAFLCSRQFAVPISVIYGRRSRAKAVILFRSQSVRSVPRLLPKKVGWRRDAMPVRQNNKRMSYLVAIPMPSTKDMSQMRPSRQPGSMLSITPKSPRIVRACCKGLRADSILTTRTMQPMLEQVSVAHDRPSPTGNRLGHGYH